MKYELGEQVVLVDNLGPANGLGRNQYYHNGDVGQVQLGLQGEIIKVAGDDNVLIRLPNGKKWRVHPNEISKANKADILGNLLPGLQGIERHPVIQLAQQTPTFLIEKRVYAVAEGDLNGRSFERRGFFWSSEKPIIEIGDFDSVDELFVERSHLEIDNAELEYAKKVQKQLDVFKRVDGELDTPQLIYRKVFPYLGNGTRDRKLAELMGVPFIETGATRTKRQIEGLEEIAISGMGEIRGMIKHIESEDDAGRTAKDEKLDSLFGGDRPKYEEVSFLSRAFGRDSLALLDGRVYDLAKDGQSKDKMHLNLNGKRFALRKTKAKFQDWEKRYNVPFSKAVRLEALRKHFSERSLMESLKDQDSAVFEIAGRDSYQEGDFGFVTSDGDYYAYLEVPQFAIRSQFDGNCYLFDGAKVAVKVWKSRNDLRYDSEFRSVENNNHPFLHNATGRFAKICAGDQDFPTSGRDMGEVIAKRLLRCREMMMYGYTSKDYNYSYRLRDDHNFGRNKADQSELERKGIPIIQGGPRA